MVDIERGLTRIVLLTQHWAIKLPRIRTHDDGLAGVLWSLTRGITANLSEREHSGARGVCPVRWSLAGLINVYPRCTVVREELTDSDYESTGYIGPVERKPENMGYLDGELVYVDYDSSWNDRPPCAHVAR